MSTRKRQPPARRMEVLKRLRETTRPLGLTELAAQLGVHVNTVRFHLDTLIANGQVEYAASEPTGPGRPAKLFRAVRSMDPAGPRHYRILAETLAATVSAAPDPSRRAKEAGRRWGRSQALADGGGSTENVSLGRAESVTRLMDVLDELDFAPELDADEQTYIGLRHCPFLELAVNRAEVVCPIHLGLMQGAMQAWGSPVTVDQLDAFVEPDLCIAHLTPQGES